MSSIASHQPGQAEKVAEFAAADPPAVVAPMADAVRAAHGNPGALAELFRRSSMPMLLIDGERRYVNANTAARLLLRKSLVELRRLRIDDLTPPEAIAMLEAAWRELLTRGSVSGPYPIGFEDGSRLDVIYWAVAYADRERHLILFAPAEWPEDELAPAGEAEPAGLDLTPREREVLRLAAEGNSASRIAELLVIGESTVKTHLANVYAKLGVPDRAAAVATAIRRGLID